MMRHGWLLAPLLAAVAACSDTGDAPAEQPAASSGALEVPARVEQLANDFETVYALGEAMLEAIAEGDFERLTSYGLDAAEWYWIVWPRLPAARRETNLSWDYAWRDLNQKSRNSARRTVASHRGKRYRLLRVEFADETTDYGTYRVHRDARCVVEDGNGRIVTLDLFGSIIERNGRFKAFSFFVD